jgi:hypothetical protein
MDGLFQEKQKKYFNKSKQKKKWGICGESTPAHLCRQYGKCAADNSVVDTNEGVANGTCQFRYYREM